jgi:hypothetical protein
MNLRPVTEIPRKAPAEVLASLRSEHRSDALHAAERLCHEARDYGLNLRDYLTLAIDPRLAAAEEHGRFADGNSGLVGGYDAAKIYLNLPARNDLKEGILLQAASDTFATFPGIRVMFPEVIDDVVKWQYRQTQFEHVENLVAQSRTIAGTEMISTVVNDDQGSEQTTVTVPEEARIPVKSIRMSQTQVGMYKHGSGYRLTYEFARRARIDIVAPYVARADIETQISKVGTAAAVLIGGDGVNAAAPVVTQSSFDSSAVAGTLSRDALLGWLISRARAGVPVDRVAGNWKAYADWLKFFSMPITTATVTDQDVLARQGFTVSGVPNLTGAVQFVLCSTVPDNQLLAFQKATTLEELVESGSLIAESERAIQNQVITYVKSEVTGYRLIFGDTRSILDYGS